MIVKNYNARQTEKARKKLCRAERQIRATAIRQWNKDDVKDMCNYARRFLNKHDLSSSPESIRHFLISHGRTYGTSWNEFFEYLKPEYKNMFDVPYDQDDVTSNRYLISPYDSERIKKAKEKLREIDEEEKRQIQQFKTYHPSGGDQYTSQEARRLCIFANFILYHR